MTNYTDYYEDPSVTPVDKIEIDVIEEEIPIIEPAYDQDKIGVINNRAVYVRRDPSFVNDPVGIVYRDDEVLVSGENEGFYKVVTAEGLNGYIFKGYVELID